MSKNVETKNKGPSKYTLESVLQSKQYSNIEKDVLKSLLVQNKEYSIDEINATLEKFMKGKVK